jgi:hypothetical protein
VLGALGDVLFGGGDGLISTLALLATAGSKYSKGWLICEDKDVMEPVNTEVRRRQVRVLRKDCLTQTHPSQALTFLLKTKNERPPSGHDSLPVVLDRRPLPKVSLSPRLELK